MRKYVFWALLILVLLFLGVYFSGEKSVTETPDPHTSTPLSPDQERTKTFWMHYYQGTEYRITEDWQHAAEAYEKALQFNDQHEDALYYLGNVNLELGRWEQAKKYWTRLVEINPQSARGHFQLGNLYLQAGDWFDVHEAEKEFKRAMEINKEETGALLKLGQVYLLKGQPDEALGFFNAVNRSNVNNVEAHVLAGFLAWQKKEGPKAAALLHKAWGNSKPVQRPKQVMGEGDTRTGKSLHRTDTLDLFYPFIEPLSRVKKETLPQHMDILYLELEQFLLETKSKIK